MKGKKPAGAAVVLIILALPAVVYGHGRNTTSLRAEVESGSVIVTINAVVEDVLQVAGISAGEWGQLGQEDSERVLRGGGQCMAERLLLIQDREHLLQAHLTEVELPDFIAGPNRWLESGQQAITIRLRYSLATPPGELTFWAIFEDGPSSVPILSQLLIRQQGELVMLPAELGPGFPISFPFNWDKQPDAIAELTDLSTVVCGWRNRPANGLLEIGEGCITWTIFIPTQSLKALLGQGEDVDPKSWESYLESAFSIRINGGELDSVSSELRVFPLSAHALSHGTHMHSVGSLDGMAEWRLVAMTDEILQPLDVTITVLDDEFPPLYNHLQTAGSGRRFSIMNSLNPSFSWRITP